MDEFMTPAEKADAMANVRGMGTDYSGAAKHLSNTVREINTGLEKQQERGHELMNHILKSPTRRTVALLTNGNELTNGNSTPGRDGLPPRIPALTKSISRGVVP
jgi:hypothetical protein